MRFILVFILLCLCGYAFGQQQTDSDTTGNAFAKKQLEKSRKQRLQFEAILVHFDGDTKAARDSLDRLRIARRQVEAQHRIESYQNNTRLDTLEEIDLSHGRLASLPNFVFQATSVERLILDYNDFSKLPGKLKQLKALRKLDWSHLQATHKKAKIPKIKSLESVDLSKNSFQKIAKLKKLKSLKTLDLSSNAFTVIPVKPLAGNKKLEDLYLDKNQQFKF